MIRILTALFALTFLSACSHFQEPPPKKAPTRDEIRLETAIYRSDAELARTALKHGVDPNGKMRNGVPFLIAAVVRQNPVLVEILLENGADVNRTDDGGETPLHAAAASSKPNVARMLLRRGANPNAAGRFGRTPLMEAVRLGKIETVKLLLEHGASFREKDVFGRNVISYAALAPEHGREILMLFAEKKEPLMPPPSDLEKSPLLSAMLNGQPDTVDYLLRQIPSYKEGDLQVLGQAAIRIAIDRNRLDWVKLLVERGVELNKTLPLVFRAARLINVDGVYKFLARNNVIDRGYTPLMWAAIRSRPQIAEYLVLQGSDIEALSNEGRDALDYANDTTTRSAIRSARKQLRNPSKPKTSPDTPAK